MRKVIFVMFGLMAICLMTMPVYAQTSGNTGGGTNWVAIASGFGIGIASGLAGLGQGRVGAAACEGMARNPAARPAIQLALILGLAFIESLVLFAVVIIFAKVV